MVEDEQVQLGLTMNGPEVRLVRLEGAEKLLDGEALPGRAHLGMAEHGAIRVDAEQGVQESGWGIADALGGALSAPATPPPGPAGPGPA